MARSVRKTYSHMCKHALELQDAPHAQRQRATGPVRAHIINAPMSPSMRDASHFQDALAGTDAEAQQDRPGDSESLPHRERMGIDEVTVATGTWVENKEVQARAQRQDAQRNT